MAEKLLNTRILLKYDTLANWNATTTYLRKGEVAIATVASGNTQEVNSVTAPQVLVKVGDGKSLFKDLPFITAKAGDVYAWAKAEKLGVEAFGADVQKLFTDIENDITALEGKVGDSKVGDQINAAITAALKKLANGDAAKAHEFVTAAVQGEDGKVVVSRKALEAADIPVIEESQVNGLTEKLGNINTEIAGVKTTATENLAEAKGYADQQVNALANDAVKKNTDAIAAINHGTTGILATANAYTDTEVGNAKTAAATDAQGKADKALADAKAYVAAEIAKVTGGGEGSLSDLETRVGVIEGDYLKEEHRAALAAATAKVAEDLSKEVERATNTDTALNGRLETVEAFFEAALKDGDGQQVIDTLKEIQEYIKSDETGAAEMLASIRANTGAIGEMPVGEDGKVNTTLVEMIAAAEGAASQAVANEETRAKGVEASLLAKIGTVAEGQNLAALIAANAKAISDHEALAAETYETKEDATAKYDEVKEYVDAKAVQADWNQNDPAAPDYVKNRTHYEDSNYLDNPVLPYGEVTYTRWHMGHWNGALNNAPSGVVFDTNKNYVIVLNGVAYNATVDSDPNTLRLEDALLDVPTDSPSKVGHPIIVYENGTINVGGTPNSDAITSLSMGVYEGTMDIKQLDEKFIPDTIARTAALESAVGRIEYLEESNWDREEEIKDLQDADTGILSRLDAVEAQLGDGESSVADLIADAKQEAIDAATDAAAQALVDAKAYTDAEVKELADGQVANTDAITAINNNKNIVKSVEGDDVVKASIANNKLTIDFDDTLTFVFNCGTSANLDPAQA